MYKTKTNKIEFTMKERAELGKRYARFMGKYLRRVKPEFRRAARLGLVDYL